MYEKRYIPLASDAGYYQILYNGKFFESCDVGEVAQRMREFFGEMRIARQNLIKLSKEVAA